MGLTLTNSVIRVWDTNGSVLAKLDDHSNYIYDLQWGQSNQLLSCGEDKILVRFKITSETDSSASGTRKDHCGQQSCIHAPVSGRLQTLRTISS
jgi:hypothetical protein